MITRILGQQLCFTRFLCERDSLSACMTRLGHGFSPNTVLSEARYHLTNINSLPLFFGSVVIIVSDIVFFLSTEPTDHLEKKKKKIQ